MKKREVYKVWRYPCEDRMFIFDEGGYLDFNEDEVFTTPVNPAKRKKDLPKQCYCGRKCKPIKCTIIVENDITEKE